MMQMALKAKLNDSNLMMQFFEVSNRKIYGFHTLDYIPITHSYKFNNYCFQKFKSCKALVASSSIKTARFWQDSNHGKNKSDFIGDHSKRALRRRIPTENLVMRNQMSCVRTAGKYWRSRIVIEKLNETNSC